MARIRSFPADNANSDPPIRRVAADVSAVDVTAPTGHFFTGLNCSIAGLVNITDLEGTTALEYMNAGWNPCTACTVILNASTTATVRQAKLAVLVVNAAS